VTPPADFDAVASALRDAERVVVCAHVSPDGDAIGSVLGLTLALREAGIDATPTLANDRTPPVTYSFLPGFDLWRRVPELDVPDTFVALDTPVASRLGIAEPLMHAARRVIVLDHHPDQPLYGNVTFTDAAMAATGQIVWRLLPALGVTPSAEIARCLYVALMTDTGRFSYDNTTPAALRDAAAMLDAGADPAEAARHVYQERSARSLALEALVLERLTRANSGRVVWSHLTDADFEVTGALPEEAEHLPDAIRSLGGIDVAALFRVKGDEIRVNLRAKTGFDVGAVGRALGGGGHRAAAGLTWEGSALEPLLERLLPLLPGGDRAQ
jgi:phosphoesterase RecJ-like protein